MKKHNMAAWMVVMAIPYVNSVAGIVLWFVQYSNVKTLKPDTRRSILKDLLLSIVTVGIFALFLPGLLMSDIQAGARRVGIDAPNYIVMYYVCFLGGLIFNLYWAFAVMSDAPNQPALSVVPYLLGMILGPLMAYFWLKPVNVLVEEFEKVEVVG